MASVGPQSPPVVVSSGQSLDDVVISSGETLIIDAGASATGIEIEGGTVQDYGTVISAGLYGGSLTVENGGVATATRLYNGETLAVDAGGTANGTTSHTAASFTVGSGMAAGPLDLEGGDSLTVASSGSVVSITVGIEAAETVAGGGSSVSGLVSGGSLTVYGVDSGTVVDSGGLEFVYPQYANPSAQTQETFLGSAFGATVNSGGELTDFGVLFGTTINAGGFVTDLDVAETTTVAGGLFEVAQGGVASATTLQSGGTETVDFGSTDSGASIGAYASQTLLPEVQNASGQETAPGGLGIGVTVMSLGTQQVDQGATAQLTTVQSGGLQIVEAGGDSVDTVVEAGGTISIGGGLVDDEAGTVDEDGVITGAGNVRQIGTGDLVLGGANSYTGGTTIDAGTLELGGPDAAGTGSITFGNVADPTVIYDAAATPANGGTFTNAVVNLGPGDNLDLLGLAYVPGLTSATLSGGTLSIGTLLDSVNVMLVDPLDSTYYAHDDGTGHVLVNDTPACYCAGTRILTDRGEVPIEVLEAGDRVLTVGGSAAPVLWVGRRSYAGRFLAGQRRLLPVLFRAGSLGGGLPRRDLRVSPQHAMLLDGVLVPAWCLVNGAGIVQETACARVDYLHLVLDRHDVILAEGAPSETFLDDGNRLMFHNAAEVAAIALPRRPCAPLIESGPGLEAIRRRIASASARAA